MRMHKILTTALIAGTATLSCLPNPEGPVLDPPGTVLLYDANFNSIQMNGGFSGISWDPTDPRNEMTLVSDYTWAITVSMLDADLTGGSINFKFTHDNNWEPESFGAGDALGQARLESGAQDIDLPVSLEQGFYTFTFDDETYRYSTDPEAATGSLGGDLNFDGETPAEGAEITLIAEHGEGDETLWSLESVNGDFAFAGLADSLYTLRASAPGYAGQTLTGLRVYEGMAADQSIILNQVFGAISGTVSFEDLAAPPYPGAIVTALDRDTQVEAGRDTSDTDTGSYLIEGLASATYDLSFGAEGYKRAGIDSIVVEGDVEVAGQDIELELQPWFVPVIDGVIDEGWDALVSDPVGDSDWGATNDFHGFHISWDDERLYVAVSGSFDTGGNAVNIYGDKDFGAGTGTTDFSVFQAGDVSNHLRKNVDASGVAGYGADFAGSVWQLQYNPQVSDLTDPMDIQAYPDAEFAMSSGAVEFSVPWVSLFPELSIGEIPTTTLAFFCLIGGGGDEYFSGDTLPAVPSAAAPNAVIEVPVSP